MTIAEAQRDDPRPVDVRIFGTDIDPGAIAFARRGIYPAGALHDVPAALRTRYFSRSGSGFEVVKPLRAEVVFGEHDLSARVPFPRIDLLLCRNVLIYFTPGCSGRPSRRSPSRCGPAASWSSANPSP